MATSNPAASPLMRVKQSTIVCGGDQRVNIQLIFMVDSVYVWAGVGSSMGNLAMAIPTKFESMPTGTVLFGEPTETEPQALAQKLAKRTKRQVFVSMQLPPGSDMLLPVVEKKIFEEVIKGCQ